MVVRALGNMEPREELFVIFRFFIYLQGLPVFEEFGRLACYYKVNIFDILASLFP